MAKLPHLRQKEEERRGKKEARHNKAYASRTTRSTGFGVGSVHIHPHIADPPSSFGLDADDEPSKQAGTAYTAMKARTLQSPTPYGIRAWSWMSIAASRCACAVHTLLYADEKDGGREKKATYLPVIPFLDPRSLAHRTRYPTVHKGPSGEREDGTRGQGRNAFGLQTTRGSTRLPASLAAPSRYIAAREPAAQYNPAPQETSVKKRKTEEEEKPASSLEKRGGKQREQERRWAEHVERMRTGGGVAKAGEPDGMWRKERAARTGRCERVGVKDMGMERRVRVERDVGPAMHEAGGAGWRGNEYAVMRTPSTRVLRPQQASPGIGNSDGAGDDRSSDSVAKSVVKTKEKARKRAWYQPGISWHLLITASLPLATFTGASQRWRHSPGRAVFSALGPHCQL
ncbi:hypothetical protein B0H16DRAFT_1460306 [Mycena metata]|uniref:Uncharacterized protein n=1 Tax=Mycena metata TaxID=1033252 RepID=A0AAD7IXJ0_9AGAR|nr:hypothetical protein B0H16DRAFT_1460306 [Mycena metata]